jgi:hypothetical protein
MTIVQADSCIFTVEWQYRYLPTSLLLRSERAQSDVTNDQLDSTTNKKIGQSDYSYDVIIQ